MSKRNPERDEKVMQVYLAGYTRKEAMASLGLTGNQLSGISNRLKLYWTLSLQQRERREEPKERTISGGFKPQKTNARAVVNPRKSTKAVAGFDPDDPALKEDPAWTALPVAKKTYGKSAGFVSSATKHALGYYDDDHHLGGRLSPFPAPTKEIPRETILFLATRLYSPLA